MKVPFSPKTVELADGTYLHFWYANNKGRGDNNCTIIRSSKKQRTSVSAKQEGVLAKVLTTSWRGQVNFSKRVQEYLGI